MAKRILIIMAHPALQRRSFCEALADAYFQAAIRAGHEVRRIHVAQLHFDPLLHEGYQGTQALEPDIAQAQQDISWAEHLLFVYPMWQFMVPALLKAFLERSFTPGFAYSLTSKNPLKAGMLKGKTARLMQSMGMPAFAYCLFFHAHGAKAFRQMLGFCGISPVKITYFGMVESTAKRRERYLALAATLGAKGK